MAIPAATIPTAAISVQSVPVKLPEVAENAISWLTGLPVTFTVP